MFEQFGSDYAKQTIDLHGLLPSVNQSEAANSIISTLFQRWVTKPNLTNVSGSIGFSKTAVAGAITESTANRQAYQLYPVFYREQGDERIVMDWNDILRKLAFTGVDPTKYAEWGTTTSFDFSPPINYDKFLNFGNYFWVNSTDTMEQPSYVVIAPGAKNDWSDWDMSAVRGNRWVYKDDLGGNFAFAKQAQLPILEFEKIELTRWYKVVRKWRNRAYAGAPLLDTDAQPNLVAITSAELLALWELQSESLVPCAPRPPVNAVPVSFDPAKPDCLLIPTPYLRGQNSVCIFASQDGVFDEFNQIVDFEEVETQGSSQHSTHVRPLSVVTGTHFFAISGPQCATDADPSAGKERTVRLAATFTSFTPKAGTTTLGTTQVRDLSEYKLLGQRKLQPYQLPLFNLYSFDVTGAFKDETTAGNIVKYTEDPSQNVQTLLGTRIVSNDSVDYEFTMDLVTEANQLLTYKHDDTAAHFTVWKNASTSTPQYVDKLRVPTATTNPGGWEPSHMLTSNPLRETRSSFKFREVINHFQSLIAGHPGTIKISDDGGNHLISSVISDSLSLPVLAKFVSDELHSFRQTMDQQIRTQLINNTTLKSVSTANIPTAIYNTLKTAALLEGGSDSAYDDTLSFDTSTSFGYPSYPLSFSVLQIVPPSDPQIQVDRKLGHIALITHDGTMFTTRMSLRDIVDLENRLSPAVIVGGTMPTPTVNHCLWRKSTTASYRFECMYFVDSQPAGPMSGDTWFSPLTNTAKIWYNQAWVAIPVSKLWVEFSVPAILLSTLALQEQDIVQLCRYRGGDTLVWQGPQSDALTSKMSRLYTDFAYQYVKQDPALIIQSSLLSTPDPLDPFTWYYGNVPNLGASSAYSLYTMLYNTPLPNKQPWILQGYTAKPGWWDTEYHDITGTRAWSTTMWTNIKAGVIPLGYALPNGNPSLGVPSEVPPVQKIPVNTSSTVIAGYDLDDLFPPYVDISAIDPAVVASTDLANSVFVTDITTLGNYVVFPSAYTGTTAGCFVENIWNTNYDRNARNLIAAYQINPIGVFTALLSQNKVPVSGVMINPITNTVSNNTDPLHGENGIVDTTFFSALTFYTRRNNFSQHNNSPLYAWKTWSTRLAYQTNSLVVPQTLRVYQDCYELPDYNLILKKSENVRTVQFSNIIVTLAQAGDPLTLPGDNGADWSFRLQCSELAPTVRYRYAPLQQDFVWNAGLQALLVTNAGEQIRWVTGEAVKIVNPPSSVTSNSFYIGVYNGYVMLYPTVGDAVSNTNAIVFDSTVLSITLRTVKATFSAGNRVWETVEVDRTAGIPFSFADNIVITGVQNVIDFIVGYTEYMQDDGIVINIGQNTVLDPDTNAVVSWQQQITKVVDRIYASTGLSNRNYSVPMISDGNGGYTPMSADRVYLTTPFVEVNPFRKAVYFHTPDGVLCDFNHTPYVKEQDSVGAIYDDTGVAIGSSELVPLRTDRLTSVVFNDSQPARTNNQTQDISRRIAYGAVSLDFYEHVIVFDQQSSNGLVIFDRFFNLQKARLNIECQKSIDFNYRPVMGGFSVSQSTTIPNFEMVGEYQRNDYDVADSNELVQSTIDSRQMLGKLPLPYFQTIPVTSKTEFQFWQQSIREKGTKGAISSFTRHALYDEATYDEYWAWKLGTFGAVINRQQVEMQLTTADSVNAISSFCFSATPTTTVSDYPIAQIDPLDQSRWINFPNYLDTVGSSGVVFGNQPTRSTTYITGGGNSFGLAVINTLPIPFVPINLLGDSFVARVKQYKITATSTYICTIQVPANTCTIHFPSSSDFATDLQHSAAFVIINNAVVNDVTISEFSAQLHVPTTSVVTATLLVVRGVPQTLTVPLNVTNHTTFAPSQLDAALQFPPYKLLDTMDVLSIVEVTGQLPAYHVVSPLRVVDTNSKNVVRTLPAWDPANGVHNNAIAQFDYVQQQDPASYNRTQLVATSSPWGSNQVGHCWLDSSTLQYKPYFDSTIFTFDEQSAAWGQLADGVAITAYQWVESTTVPTVKSPDLPFTQQVRKTRSSTSVSWDDASVVSALVDPLRVTYSTRDSLDSVHKNVFAIPTNWLTVLAEPTSGAIVRVNGISTGNRISSDNKIYLVQSVTNGVEVLRTMQTSDIITIEYPASAINSGGQPSDASPDLSYVQTDVPYVEVVQYINQATVTKYYYWAAKPTQLNNPLKAQTLPDAVANLTQPPNGNFFAIRSDRSMLSIWGLYDVHQIAKKALAIDLDHNLRDRYTSAAASKVQNEQWIIFREAQDDYPHSSIWAAIVATVSGSRVINSVNSVVPNPARATYDYLYGTTLQYGTDVTQTLISPARARVMFTEFFSAANPLVDATLHVLFENPLWIKYITTYQYASACDFVYKNFPATLLNTFIFEILREGLYSGYEYTGLFKTSYVALQTSQKVMVK
jgi:hypothetical protein